MATNALSISALLDAKATPRPPPSAALPPPPVQFQGRLSKTTAYCGKLARNVVAMATTGEAPVAAPVVTPNSITTETSSDDADPSEILKTIQEAWDKVDDKYAASSLAVAGFVGLWGTAGLISAIDRLPLVPGLLEVVGIGYSGWFAYKNLINKTDRDALIQKMKNTYKDIIGSS